MDNAYMFPRWMREGISAFVCLETPGLDWTSNQSSPAFWLSQGAAIGVVLALGNERGKIAALLYSVPLQRYKNKVK